MGHQCAETLSKGVVPVRREILIAKEDDEVFVKRVPDFFESLVGHGLGEIHTVNLRAERARHRFNPERCIGHFRLLVREFLG